MSPQIPQSPEEYWLFGYGSLIWKPPPHYGNLPNYYFERWNLIFPYRPQSSWIHQRLCEAFLAGEVGYAVIIEDHRGTPEAPGRVVTLIERSAWKKLGDHHEADDVVWGVAYRIERSKIEETKEYKTPKSDTLRYGKQRSLKNSSTCLARYLDIREINGYSIHTVDVYQGDPSVALTRATVYIGTPDNPQFIKEIPEVEDLARHIFNSCGPSGENREYLLRLHRAILDLHPGSRDNHVNELSAIVETLMENEGKQGASEN